MNWRCRLCSFIVVRDVYQLYVGVIYTLLGQMTLALKYTTPALINELHQLTAHKIGIRYSHIIKYFDTSIFIQNVYIFHVVTLVVKVGRLFWFRLPAICCFDWNQKLVSVIVLMYLSPSPAEYQCRLCWKNDDTLLIGWADHIAVRALNRIYW